MELKEFMLFMGGLLVMVLLFYFILFAGIALIVKRILE